MSNNEDIRKKEKKLSREHWMCRVQKYTFGIDAPTYYMGYCPFFWMTWLSLLVLPIVFISKTFYRVSCVPIVPVLDYLDKRADARKENLSKSPLEPGWEVIVDVFDKFGKKNKINIGDGEVITLENCTHYLFAGNRERAERIRLWFLQNPKWRETHLEAAKAKREAAIAQIKREEQEAREWRKRREMRSRKLASAASLCGKGLFKLLIPVVIIAAGIAGYYGIVKACTMITLHGTLGAFTFLCGFAAAVVAARIIWDFLVTFVFTEPVKDFLAKVLEKILGDSGIIDGFFYRIRNIWIFAKDTVALTYKAECPLILWGEETGNITRRENRKDPK